MTNETRKEKFCRKFLLAVAAVAAVFGAKAENALPDGYARLPYVRSTGSQWIDTKVKLKSSYRVELDFEPTSIRDSTKIFGARNGSATNLNFSAAWTKSVGFYADFYNYNSRRLAYTNMAVGVRYYLTVDKEHAQLKQDGLDEPVAEVWKTVEDDFVTTQTCYLFSVHTVTSDSYLHWPNFTGLLYAFRITDRDSGEKVRDFVPCKQLHDATVGLYDLHEGKFYPSEGDEAFIGPQLPSGYLRLPYIRSTGSQYIDTKVNLRSSHRVEMDFEATSLTGNTRIFGSRNGSATDLNFSAGWTQTLGIYADFYNYNSRRLNYEDFAVGTRYHLTVDKEHAQLKQDGLDEPVAEDRKVVGDDFVTAKTCFLFSFQTGGGDSAKKWENFTGLLYEFKISDANDLIDMVPVRNDAGVCGLYDIVHAEFYGNDGPGAFSCDGDIVVDNETVTMNRFSALDDYCVGPADEPASLVLKGAKPIFQNTEVGTATSNSANCTSTTSTGTIGIFGCPNGSNHRSSVAVYSVRIWKNNALVHELVPCRRLSDGIGGLYDLVDHDGENGVRFLTNSYSAENFTMPSKATGDSPSAGYERLAWIKAGGKQIIDTGFIADSDTRVEVLFDSCAIGADNVAVLGFDWAKSWLLQISANKFRYSGDSEECYLGDVAKHTDYRAVITGSQVTLEPLAPTLPGSLATAFAFGNGIGDDGVGEQVKAMKVRFEPTGAGFDAAPVMNFSTQRGIALYDGTVIEVSDEMLDSKCHRIPLMYDAGGFAQTPLTAAKLETLKASAKLPAGMRLVYDEERKTLYCVRGGLVIFVM